MKKFTNWQDATEAAEMLGVTPRTISRMLRDGRLRRNADGKIDRDDIARIVHG
jgi:excisionase family DNA binding protein